MHGLSTIQEHATVIRPVHAAIAAADQAAERRHLHTFIAVARSLALAGRRPGDEREIADSAEHAGHPEAARIVRAAVSGATLPGSTEGIGDFAPASAAFTATLSLVGIFDWILQSMQPGVLHSRFGIAVSHAHADEVGSGESAPVTKLQFSPGSLQARRAATIAVLSRDLLFHGRGIDIVESSLRAGQVRAVDASFLAAVSAAASVGTSSGSTAGHVLADLQAAVATLAPGTGSALHVVVTPAVATRLAFMSTTSIGFDASPPELGGAPSGQRAFPEMTPTGGILAGIPCRASDEAPDDVTLIDAAGYVGVAEDVQLRRSEQASIHMVTQSGMDTSPPIPAELVNMFQTNSVAVHAERRFGFSALRPAAVKIASVTWGQ